MLFPGCADGMTIDTRRLRELQPFRPGAECLHELYE
jgi:hypothetical protein